MFKFIKKALSSEGFLIFKNNSRIAIIPELFSDSIKEIKAQAFLLPVF